jgi:hypothetical protein
LYSWVYRMSFKEIMFEAELAGRETDKEEAAFFELVDKLRESKTAGEES